MMADGIPMILPDVSCGLYLIDYLFDAGPVEHSGMGPVPLSNLELQAWMDGSGTPLEPWEFTLIRSLSKSYLTEMVKGKDPACPPPYVEVDADVRAAVSRTVALTLRARALERRAQERKKAKRAKKGEASK